MVAHGLDVAVDVVPGDLSYRLTRYPTDIILLDAEWDQIRALCVGLRAHGIHIPIIALADANRSSDVLAVLHAGADAFIAKPIRFEDVAAQVRRLTVRRPSRSP
jgi:DNA-binding response OmpR family regulator